MRKRIVASLLVLLLSSPIAAADFNPSGIAPAGLPIDAELGRISVIPAGWQSEIYPLPPTLPPLSSGVISTTAKPTSAASC